MRVRACAGVLRGTSLSAAQRALASGALTCELRMPVEEVCLFDEEGRVRVQRTHPSEHCDVSLERTGRSG